MDRGWNAVVYCVYAASRSSAAAILAGVAIVVAVVDDGYGYGACYLKMGRLACYVLLHGRKAEAVEMGDKVKKVTGGSGVQSEMER